MNSTDPLMSYAATRTKTSDSMQKEHLNSDIGENTLKAKQKWDMEVATSKWKYKRRTID